MSDSNKSLAYELSNILDELNDDDLAELPEDKILEMRKKLNPYGRTIQGSDRYLNFSITQLSHEYWKKLIMSALVGYLNRACDEWKVPDGVPVVPVYEYLDDNTKLDTPQSILDKGYQKTIDEYEDNRNWMKKRIIVKEFLEEMFQFNPEEHVRSSYRPCYADTSRKPINTLAGKLAVNHLKRTDSEFRASVELHEDINGTTDVKNDVKEYKIIKRAVKVKDPVTGKVKVKLVKTKVPVETNDTNDGKKLPENMEDNKLPKTVRSFLPPHDIYGRFRMYMESNLEPLRDFVRDAFCIKPDLELAINPYSVHETEDEAEKFKKKHRNEVIAEVFTAHCGKWNFFDTFKEQRDNVNFYNDNTIIIEEMIKQLKSDEKLGQDLMKKRVKKVKKKNEIEVGPDAESFKKWRDQNSTIKNMGAAHIGDVVDDDIPDDAIQVDVWRVAKGGLELTKDKFYTASEAPTFVEETKEDKIDIPKAPTLTSRNDNIN